MIDLIKERKSFEDSVRSRGGGDRLLKMIDGTYADRHTESGWKGWQSGKKIVEEATEQLIQNIKGEQYVYR